MNRSGYSPEELELIRFALLTAHFYDHPHLQNLRKANSLPLDQIAAFTQVPEDWLIRWDAGDPSKFLPEEVVFAFVASIDLHIHSDNLARLGCAITDCPGLNASSWDNQVATRAINRADAVLYLIQGQHTLSLSDLKSVRALPLARGMILVGANVRGIGWDQTKRVIEATAQVLSDADLGIAGENIHPYHAELGLLARHLQKGPENLDALSRTALADNLRIPPGPDQLSALRRRLQTRICTHFNTLTSGDAEYSEKLPALALAESRIHILLNTAEKFVLNNKASAILAGNTEKILRILARQELELKQEILDADQSAAESEEDFKRADAALESFQHQASSLINGLGKSLPSELTKDFRKELSEAIEWTCVSAVEMLAGKLNETGFIDVLMSDKELIVRRLSNRTVRYIRDAIQGFLQLWASRLTGGEVPSYARFLQELASIEKSLREHWTKTIGKQMPAFTEEIVEKELLEEIPAMVAETLAMDELEEVLEARLGLFEFLTGWFKQDPADQIRGALRGSLEGIRDDLIKGATPVFEHRMSSCRATLEKKWVEQPRKSYQRTQEKARARMALAQNERQKIAGAAQHTLATQIEPLRTQCRAFIEKILSSPPVEKIPVSR